MSKIAPKERPKQPGGGGDPPTMTPKAAENKVDKITEKNRKTILFEAEATVIEYIAEVNVNVFKLMLPDNQNSIIKGIKGKIIMDKILRKKYPRFSLASHILIKYLYKKNSDSFLLFSPLSISSIFSS